MKSYIVQDRFRYFISTNGKKNTIHKILRQRYLFIMLLPSLIFALIFCYLPLLGWIVAFKDYKLGLSIFDAKWTGLLQFKNFFVQGSDFLYILRNTLAINCMSLVVGIGFSFIFAILLREIKCTTFSKVVQTATFFPFFVSWVIVYSIANSLLSVTSGALNETLIQLGIIKDGINFLGDKKYAWQLIVFFETWKYLGYNSVIFLAAAAGIPKEQYEACEIDGANRFDKIRHVTIPNLLPTLVVIMIMSSGWILNSNFEEYFLFTNPTNWEYMEVFSMYVYKFGLKLLDFPYSTAVGIIQTAASIFILMIVNRLAKKLSGKALI